MVRSEVQTMETLRVLLYKFVLFRLTECHIEWDCEARGWSWKSPPQYIQSNTNLLFGFQAVEHKVQ